MVLPIPSLRRVACPISSQTLLAVSNSLPLRERKSGIESRKSSVKSYALALLVRYLTLGEDSATRNAGMKRCIGSRFAVEESPHLGIDAIREIFREPELNGYFD